MKSRVFQPRFYRKWVYPKGLFRQEVVVRESDLQILSDKPLDKDFAAKRIKFYRDQIEEYINYKERRFLTSLKPVPVERTACPIVREMAKESRKANVGPMACVAGAIAQFLGQDLLRRGYRELIIENGGDIFLKVSRPIKVGLYCGRGKKFNQLALKIKPRHAALGIGCSSGTLGHSLSFGCADSVVIFAKNAILADGVATAVANRIRKRSDLARALDYARSIRGVSAGLAVLKNGLAGWGSLEFA